MSIDLSRALLLGASVSLLALTPLAAQEGRPPPPVGVIVVQAEDLAVTSELPGRIAATRVADVRPRVSGIVETREFEQGSVVSEGDVLFRLDSASYEIAVEAAQAGLARAEAVLKDAQATEKRFASLNERNITSQAEYETAIAARLQAAAAVAEAKANLRAAEISLSYTEVKAPISGVIGRAQVTEGALVAAGGEVLTTIQQLDPVYADIQQPVSELLRLRAALKGGALTQVEPGAAKVEMLMDDGSLYDEPGKLLFAEASVERTSGQITLRAEFPNAEGDLLPGMYVRVMLEQATETGAIAVPGQAVQRDPAGNAFLYVLDEAGLAQVRQVRLGRSDGNRMTVSSGLAAGDVVIVDGFQKMGAGAPVAPVCWADPSKDAAPAGVCTQRFAAPAAPEAAAEAAVN